MTRRTPWRAHQALRRPSPPERPRRSCRSRCTSNETYPASRPTNLCIERHSMRDRRDSTNGTFATRHGPCGCELIAVWKPISRLQPTVGPFGAGGTAVRESSRDASDTRHHRLLPSLDGYLSSMTFQEAEIRAADDVAESVPLAKAPAVSVVMITRNRSGEALRALERLVRLPEGPPVIVVDNGSTDDTVAAVRAAFGDRVALLA